MPTATRTVLRAVASAAAPVQAAAAARRRGRRRGAGRRRRGAAAGRVDGLLAACRNFDLFFSRHCSAAAPPVGTLAQSSVVGAAGAADRGNLRTARLPGRCGRGSLGSVPPALRRPARRPGWPEARRPFLGASAGSVLGLCGGFRLASALGSAGASDGADRALAARGEARHVLLQALQRRHAARRDAGAMRFIVRAALRLGSRCAGHRSAACENAGIARE